MAHIHDKIKDIERNIKEGELMLCVLRKLPNSDETSSQIIRFQELVNKLQEYKNRYHSLEISSTQDLECQLQALRDKHERIQSLLEQTTNGVNCTSEILKESTSQTLNNADQISNQNFKSSRTRDSDADSDEAEPINNIDLEIIPTKNDATPTNNEDQNRLTNKDINADNWLLHFKAQTCQLTHMLTQVDRYDEMVNRLTDLVNAFEANQPAELLCDVSQRFIELRASLLSLQKAYDGLENEKNLSYRFKSHQLFSLQEFLISLGRNLEVTKECFFSVANIVKQSINRSDVKQVSDSRDVGLPLIPDCENNSDVLQHTDKPQSNARENDFDADKQTVGNEEDKEKYEQGIVPLEATIATLCKQRDELLHQLAESRALQGTCDSISESEEKLSGLSKFIDSQAVGFKTEPSTSQPMSAAKQTTGHMTDELPILQKLQARKNHLQELHSELKALCLRANVVDDQLVEANKKCASKDETNIDKGLAATIRVPPPRPKTSPRQRSKVTIPNEPTLDMTILNGFQNTKQNTIRNVDVFDNLLDLKPVECIRSNSTKVLHNGDCKFPGDSLETESIGSSNAEESSTFAQKTDVVTFQEPEATCLDDTERLYRTIREASIWREESRKAKKEVLINMQSINSLANKTSNGIRAVSETTSHDQTGMATWGGSYDDGEYEADAFDEYTNTCGTADLNNASKPANQTNKGIPTIYGSTNSSTDSKNGHRLIDNVNSPPISSQRSLLVETSTYSRTNLDKVPTSELTLPRLGHSPLPQKQNELTTKKLESLLNVSNTSHSKGDNLRLHRTIQPECADVTVFAEDGNSNHISINLQNQILTQLSLLGNRVDQLSQTCNLLMTENVRLNTNITFLLANQAHLNQINSSIGSGQFQDYSGQSYMPTMPFMMHQPALCNTVNEHPKIASPCSTRIPQNFAIQSSVAGSVKSTPMPGYNGVIRYPCYRNMESAYCAPLHMRNSSVLSNSMGNYACAQPPPILDNAMDQVNALNSQVIQQQSRVNQLQKEIQLIMHHQKPEEQSEEYGHASFKPPSVRNHLLSPQFNNLVNPSLYAGSITKECQKPFNSGTTTQPHALTMFTPHAWVSQPPYSLPEMNNDGLQQ